MLNLREYRAKPTRLSDFLPWAALVAPGVVLQKDRLLQTTIAFRGPDLASASGAELQAGAATRQRLAEFQRTIIAERTALIEAGIEAGEFEPVKDTFSRALLSSTGTAVPTISDRGPSAVK